MKTAKIIDQLIYASLMSLALGLFTSMSFLALTHIFIFLPCLYFLPKTNWKRLSKSAYCLLGIIISIVLSIVLNQDIAVNGYASLSKVKYYLIGLLSIVPFSYYFSKLKESDDHDKKISWLLYALIGTTTLATISGMSGYFFGFNFLKLKFTEVSRNQGLAGMLMNYAHNLAFFQIILVGLILYRKEVNRYININFLYVAWAINLLGLYTTHTRGAMLAFIVALPFFYFKQNKKLFLIATFTLSLCGYGIYKLSGKSIERPQSDIERMSQWKAAVAGFIERPVLGVGYLNFEKVSRDLKRKYNIEEPDFGGHAHSNYFEMLASTGAVGFSFFALWLGFWFYEMYKRDDVVARLALPFIVVFLVGGITQATFVLGANLFFIMPAYALTQTINRNKS